MSQDEERRNDDDEVGLGSSRFWKSPNTVDAQSPEPGTDNPPMSRDVSEEPPAEHEGVRDSEAR